LTVLCPFSRSDIWKFIYLAQLPAQKKKKNKANKTSAQVDELYWFVLFVPATWGEEDVQQKRARAGGRRCRILGVF